MEPVWYLGAYNLYVQLTFPLFAEAFGPDLDKAMPLLLSLVKVIFLDIGLALRTYFQREGRNTIEAGYSFAVRMQKIAKIYDKLLSKENGRANVHDPFQLAI